MKRFIGIAFCLIAVIGLLLGCGGSASVSGASGGGGDSLASFAGSYAASYAAGPVIRPASTGNMSIAVASNGQITITIVDSAKGTFVGTGIANHVGGFYITCNGVGGKQVTVNGTLKGTGLGRTAQGTIAGTINVTYNAALLNDPDATVYTNHYEGAYAQGTGGGNWLGDVGTNGAFAGQLILQNGMVDITGNVYSNGSFKFTGKDGATKYEVTGNFTLDQAKGVVCNGLLKGTTGSTTVTGAFSGHTAIGG